MLSELALRAGAKAGGSLAWHKYKLRWLPLQPLLSVLLATWPFNSKGRPLGAVSVALLWRSTSPLKSRVPLSLIALLRLASKIAVAQMSSGAGTLMTSCHLVTHCVHVAYRYFFSSLYSEKLSEVYSSDLESGKPFTWLLFEFPIHGPHLAWTLKNSNRGYLFGSPGQIFVPSIVAWPGCLPMHFKQL